MGEVSIPGIRGGTAGCAAWLRTPPHLRVQPQARRPAAHVLRAARRGCGDPRAACDPLPRRRAGGAGRGVGQRPGGAQREVPHLPPLRIRVRPASLQMSKRGGDSVRAPPRPSAARRSCPREQTGVAVEAPRATVDGYPAKRAGRTGGRHAHGRGGGTGGRASEPAGPGEPRFSSNWEARGERAGGPGGAERANTAPHVTWKNRQGRNRAVGMPTGPASDEGAGMRPGRLRRVPSRQSNIAGHRIRSPRSG